MKLISAPSAVTGLFKRRAKKPKNAENELDARAKQQRTYLTPQQDMTEFSGFLRMLLEHDVRSYLEIGCRYGGTFNMVMRLLPPGSRGVAVDLPGGNWGTKSSKRPLQWIVDALKADGIDVDLILGDSTSCEVINLVTQSGPFDAALLDGDHLYKGAKADWDNYGNLARLVAFHDVAGDGVSQISSGLPVEVPILWNEIKSDGLETHEFIRPNSRMGIGVVVQDG